MAKRGRKPKVSLPISTIEQELEDLRAKSERDITRIYKDLAKIKDYMQNAYNYISDIDTSRTIADAAFKAGRSFNHLDRANDMLEDVLQEIFEDTDLDHWEDVLDNN